MRRLTNFVLTAQPWLERLTWAIGAVALGMAVAANWHWSVMLIPFVLVLVLFGVVLGCGALTDALDSLARKIESAAQREGVDL